MIDSNPVQVYDFDMFSVTTDVINHAHSLGRVVVCYIDTIYEPSRPDSKSFTSDVLGNNVVGWPGQKWVDIRSNVVKNIMANRVQQAYAKGCDAIEWDDVDGYANNPGFSFTGADQITFNTWLANITHAHNMSAGLKNDLDQVSTLVRHFEFAVNEQCKEYNECSKLKPFTDAGKAVFSCEYNGSASDECPSLNSLKLSTIFASEDLSGSVKQCCSYASPACAGAPLSCLIAV